MCDGFRALRATHSPGYHCFGGVSPWKRAIPTSVLMLMCRDVGILHIQGIRLYTLYIQICMVIYTVYSIYSYT